MHFHIQLENQVLQTKGFCQNHKGNYVALFDRGTFLSLRHQNFIDNFIKDLSGVFE